MRDYPCDEEIERVKKWEFHGPDSFVQFMAFVRLIGKYWPSSDPFGWDEDPVTRTYNISTGGWSGNEAILGAMQDNLTFWMVCWQEHRRGGHYIFQLPDPIVYFRKEAQP